MGRAAGGALIGALLMGVLGDGRAQTPSIYSCTDAQGRQRTSDRSIAECADREQRLLNPSGTVRATVPLGLSRRCSRSAHSAMERSEVR